MNPEYLVEKAIEKLNYVLEHPVVPKNELIPLMNYVSAIIGHLYLAANQSKTADEKRKYRDLIKGLENLVSVLKYQYKSYVDFRPQLGGEDD